MLPTKKNRSVFDQMFSDFDSVLNMDSKGSVSTFDNLFNQFFNQTNPYFKKSGIKISGMSYPKVNILEFSDKYIVIADIGSLQKDDIKISIDEDSQSDVLIVTLAANKKSNFKELYPEKFTYLYKELSENFGCFYRKFYFNVTDVDSKSMSAEFESGLLKLSINKKVIDTKKEVISRQLEIK
jgi:HSP20 family molecular chaperone IbpA